MNKAILNKQLQYDLLDAAVLTMTRCNKPTLFAVALDSDSVNSDGSCNALAHVVVVSAEHAKVIESYFGERITFFETTRKEFVE